MKRIVYVLLLALALVVLATGFAYADVACPPTPIVTTDVPKSSDTPQPPVPTFYVTEWAATPPPSETLPATKTESLPPTPQPTITEIPETVMPIPSDTPFITTTSIPYPIPTVVSDPTPYPMPSQDTPPKGKRPTHTAVPTLPVTGGGLADNLPLIIVAMVLLLGIMWIVRAIRTSNGRTNS